MKIERRRLVRWLGTAAPIAIVAGLAALGSTPGIPSPAVLASETAFFKFDYPPNPETFIFAATDPKTIEEARAILRGERPGRIVAGTIVKQLAGYNLPWSYQLEPASVRFADAAVEVCDAAIRYVEEHLDEACGAFLPGCTWCPWGSRLLEEIAPAATPIATAVATPLPTTTPTARPTIWPTITTMPPSPSTTVRPTPELHILLYLPLVLKYQLR
jgi:hypothetical protein